MVQRPRSCGGAHPRAFVASSIAGPLSPSSSDAAVLSAQDSVAFVTEGGGSLCAGCRRLVFVPYCGVTRNSLLGCGCASRRAPAAIHRLLLGTSCEGFRHLRRTGRQGRVVARLGLRRSRSLLGGRLSFLVALLLSSPGAARNISGQWARG